MRSVDVALRPAELARDSARLAGTHNVEVGSVDIFEDFAAAAPAWDRLAASAAVATPFGRRDWIELWQRHVGAAAGLRPLIAVARDRRGEPLIVLPLVFRPRRMITFAHFFGGRHSQLNMALWRRDARGVGGVVATGFCSAAASAAGVVFAGDDFGEAFACDFAAGRADAVTSGPNTSTTILGPLRKCLMRPPSGNWR